MATTMTFKPDSSRGTRPSLLQRLQQPADGPAHARGWREFYEVYSGLIRAFATRSGLSPEEAEDVVQETAIGVARGLPGFVYDPKVCRFRTWLLNQTRWQIRKQIEKRAPTSVGPVEAANAITPPPGLLREETSGTDLLARIADPAGEQAGAAWDAAWEENMLAKALERVRARLEARQFQIFDLFVTKEWPASRVAETLGISVARVYVTKHRVTAMLKREVRRLEREAEQALRKLD